jgi:hypothetical protein
MMRWLSSTEIMASIAEVTKAGIKDLSSTAGRALAFAGFITSYSASTEMFDSHQSANSCSPSQSKTAQGRRAATRLCAFFATPGILPQVPWDFAER